MKINSIKPFSLPRITKRESKKINIKTFEKVQEPSNYDLGYVTGYNLSLPKQSINESKNKTLIKSIIKNQDTDIIYRGYIPNKKAWGNICPKGKNMPSHHFAYTHNEDFNIKQLYIHNIEEGTTNVYNSKGELTKTYSSDDLSTLKEYKMSSIYVTSKLRNNEYWGTDIDSIRKTEFLIKTLTNIFSDNKKHNINDKNRTLFRTMHLPLKDIGEVGDIFTDKSFVSTSTNTETPKDFQSKKYPIMIIDFPKGAKYIDIDDVLNIDKIRFKENEYLLNKDSQFLITKVDKKRNLLQATYLLTDEEKANLNEN